MVQSIKTEIIYYGMQSDFEFEFNLCGCCQMRLLKETANETAGLLRALQKGISRSRVIFVVGKISGEKNAIEVVSKAIGYSCERLDTSFYDVKTAEPIYIIKNSVPLISADGTFGGCIIESGPQSMIFLTEDKRVRKEIMQSLVNSYIADLSRYQFTPDNSTKEDDAVLENEAIAEEQTAEPTLEEVSEPILEEVTQTPEQEETEAEVEAEAEEELEFEDIASSSDTADAEEEKYDPYKIENIIKSEDLNLANATEYTEEEITDSYSAEDDKKSANGYNIATLILSCILLVLLAFIVYSFIYLPLSNGASVAENFTNLFSFLRE